LAKNENKKKSLPSLLAARVILVFASLVLSIMVTEIGLRLFVNESDLIAGDEVTVWRDNAAREKGFYTPDSELGYRPVLGTTKYDEHGTMRNRYALAKPPGKTRVLFIGDSVTHRATIVEALRERYGEQSFEYWNAGVEGFNTPQEVAFYLRWNHRIEPDHVILTFHNNDFEITPVAYVDDQDRMRVFSPSALTEGVNTWLYGNSYVYRLYRRVRANFAAEQQRDDLAVRVRESLARLRDQLQARGIQLSVVLFPVLSPPEEWDSWQQWSRQRALAILAELNLRCFDLFEPLTNALANGLPVREELSDHWHPNKTGARCFVDYLVARGLLGKLPLEADRTVFKVGKPAIQRLACAAGKVHARSRYIVLGSASGIANGHRCDGLEIPLGEDAYLRFLVTNPNTLIANSAGVLDDNGRAVATVSLPKDLVAGNPDATLFHAFVVYRESPPACTFVSNAVPLRFAR